MEGDAAEDPVACVSREEVPQALDEKKAPGPSELSLELIAASGGVGIQVKAEICQNVLDGFGMPAEWALCMVVPIFKRKGDIRNCSCYRAAKLLDHGMKVVERKLEKILHRIVTVDEMQVGFMPEKGTIDGVFISRRLQEEYHAKGKTFDRVPRKVLQWVMRKKGIPEVSVRSLMCLYEGVKTRVSVASELSEEFEVKVWMHQGSVLSPLLFAMVVDVVTEFTRGCAK